MRVNWLDADVHDDEACTESFAATELRHLLPRFLGVPSEEITLTDTLQGGGDAVVLGTRLSSPLIARLMPGPAPPPQGFHPADGFQASGVVPTYEYFERLYGR